MCNFKLKINSKPLENPKNKPFKHNLILKNNPQ